MRALISGIAGFIGSNLARRLLADGYEVRGVDNLSTGSLENVAGLDVDMYVNDLCNEGVAKRMCEGIDVIFHQAALGSVPRSVDDPATTIRNNVMSTVNLLVAAREAGIRRFVHASSASVYGSQYDGLVVREGMALGTSNPYATSKLAAEEAVLVFGRTYGMGVVCLRYFNVFGPRQNPEGAYAAVVPKFISCALEGRAPTIDGDGEQARDFTHVDNVVEANVLAATAPVAASSHAYNVSAGSMHTVAELWDAVRSEVPGVEGLDAEHGPARVGDVRGYSADLTFARVALGYKPIVSFEAGISKTIKWYRENR